MLSSNYKTSHSQIERKNEPNRTQKSQALRCQFGRYGFAVDVCCVCRYYFRSCFKLENPGLFSLQHKKSTHFEIQILANKLKIKKTKQKYEKVHD